MNTTKDPSELAGSVGELLALDRSLHPSERAVLGALLLHPRPTTARELSRSTRTNLQALYVALDRLENRGLIARGGESRSRTYRIVHPSVVLQELSEPWRRAGLLANGLEEPLRELYEMGEVRLLSSASARATSTTSFLSCLGALLDRVRSSTQEIWFLGSELPWFGASSPLESQLAVRRPHLGMDPQVRLLVRRPPPGGVRRQQLHRLERGGLALRHSNLWSSPLVVVDRRWIFLASGGEESTGRSPTSYTWIEAPGLAGDLCRLSESVWGAATPAGRSSHGAARTSVSGKPSTDRARDRPAVPSSVGEA